MILKNALRWGAELAIPKEGDMEARIPENPSDTEIEKDALQQFANEQQQAIVLENEALKAELGRLQQFVAEQQQAIVIENEALKAELGRLQQFVTEQQQAIVAENRALKAELGCLQQFVEKEQRAIVRENDVLRRELGRVQRQIEASLQTFIDERAPIADPGIEADDAWFEIGRAASKGIAIQRVPQICFLHISKTAGTSVHHFLKSAIRGPVFQGDFDNATRKDLRPFSLVMGHMSYHHTRKLRRPYTLITFLRDPVERVISTYFYLRRSDSPSRLAELCRNLSFREFLLSEDPDAVTFVRDHQTYALASDYRTHRSYDRDMVLRAAWAHLQEFAFVGFVEHFELSMKRLSRLLGVPFQTPPHLNAAPEPHRDALNDADVALARELNDLDCGLYDRALQRFLPALLSRQAYAESLLQYRTRLRRERKSKS